MPLKLQGRKMCQSWTRNLARRCLNLARPGQKFCKTHCLIHFGPIEEEEEEVASSDEEYVSIKSGGETSERSADKRIQTFITALSETGNHRAVMVSKGVENGSEDGAISTDEDDESDESDESDKSTKNGNDNVASKQSVYKRFHGRMATPFSRPVTTNMTARLCSEYLAMAARRSLRVPEANKSTKKGESSAAAVTKGAAPASKQEATEHARRSAVNAARALREAIDTFLREMASGGEERTAVENEMTHFQEFQKALTQMRL